MTFKKFVVLCGLLMLTACSQIRLGYNNAVPVLRWMLSDYVSIRDDQDADFKARLTAFHAWHRQNELPEYVKLARMISVRVARGLNADDLTQAFTLARERYRVLISRAIDDAAPVMARFDAAQIAQLESGFAKANQKFQKEQMAENTSERLGKRIEKMQDNYEDWLGSLNAAQKQRIADAARSMADTTTFQLAERQRNQQIFLGLLRAHASAVDMATRLKALLADPDVAREPQYRAVMATNEKMTIELLLSLDKLGTTTQREHVVHRFNEYANDFAKLSKAAATS